MADEHRVDALLDMGSSRRLLEGAATLALREVDAAAWACTSGGFVFEVDGAQRQARRLEESLGVPVTSTSLAFAAALAALGVRRVAVAATYPKDVAALFAEFLAAGGVEVVHVGSLGILSGSEVGTLGREHVLRLARENDHPDAEAILLPDTALHTGAWLEELEEAVGKLVLTANQVTTWDVLRLAGWSAAQEGLGSLFRLGATATRPQ